MGRDLLKSLLISGLAIGSALAVFLVCAAAHAQNYPVPTLPLNNEVIGCQQSGHFAACTPNLIAAKGGYTPLSQYTGTNPGSTDETTNVQAALNALSGTGKGLLVDCRCHIGGSGTGITIPVGVPVMGSGFQGSDPATPATGAAFICAAGNYVCVTQAGLNSTNIVSGQVSNLTIIGSTSPTTGSVGLSVAEGYQQLDVNVKVYGFYDCISLISPTGGTGIMAKFYNVNATACSDAYVLVDGWPELYWFGGRFGDRGNVNLSSTDVFRFTNTSGGPGPNTIYLNGLQINPGKTIAAATSAVQCVFDFRNFASAPKVLTEFKVEGSHIEYGAVSQANPQATFTGSIATTAGGTLTVTHIDPVTGGAIQIGQTITGAGVTAGTVITSQVDGTHWLVNNSQTVGSETLTSAASGVFCSDNTLPNLLDIWVGGGTKITSGSGILLPMFALSPSTQAQDIFIENAVLNGGLSTNNEISLTGPQVNNVHVSHSRIDGGVNYASQFSNMVGTITLTNTLTVSSITNGVGPQLYAQVGGSVSNGITGQVWISADGAYDTLHGTTSCNNGASACTGVSGSTTGTFALGVPPGGTGTITAGLGSQTYVQNAGNSVDSEGNVITGAFTGSGYWEGGCVPMPRCAAFIGIDTVLGGYADTMRGGVAMSTPPQAFTSYRLNSCASPGCATPITAQTQTVTGYWWRDIETGFTLAGNIAVASGGSVAVGNLEIGGLPSQLVCNSAPSFASIGTTSTVANFQSLTSTIIPVYRLGTTPSIQLFQQGAASTAQLTNANGTTSGMTINFQVRCPQAN